MNDNNNTTVCYFNLKGVNVLYPTCWCSPLGAKTSGIEGLSFVQSMFLSKNYNSLYDHIKCFILCEDLKKIFLVEGFVYFRGCM